MFVAGVTTGCARLQPNNDCEGKQIGPCRTGAKGTFRYYRLVLDRDIDTFNARDARERALHTVYTAPAMHVDKELRLHRSC